MEAFEGLEVSRYLNGTSPFRPDRCPECPESVPTLFPSRNGTSRRCPEVGCVVSRAPRSKGAGHGTGHGTTRLARLAIHACDAIVITGLDDDRAALTATCDPHRLTPAGEVAALTDGRWTYQLVRRSLDRRDRWNIPGHPPSVDLPVLAEHRCGQPVPADWLAPPAPPAPRPATPVEF